MRSCTIREEKGYIPLVSIDSRYEIKTAVLNFGDCSGDQPANAERAAAERTESKHLGQLLALTRDCSASVIPNSLAVAMYYLARSSGKGEVRVEGRMTGKFER